MAKIAVVDYVMGNLRSVAKDKRASEKERDWAREKERVLRHTTR